jgi:hypothetical protein
MSEQTSKKIVYDLAMFDNAMEEVRGMLQKGNFKGTGTRRRGLTGDIEAVFGWHAGDPDQPITDNTVTDEHRGRWLERLLIDVERLGTIEDSEIELIKGDSQSTPRSIVDWMQDRKQVLLGEKNDIEKDADIRESKLLDQQYKQSNMS